MSRFCAWRLRGLALALALAVGAGCESFNRDDAALAGATGGGSTSSGGGAPAGGGEAPSEISGPITWLHTNVSDWPVTASLSASVGGGTINMPYSKSKTWHAVDGVNANPWVIVYMNGKWYAATFEYLRHGQTSKPMGVLSGAMGDHIKVSPLSGWRPHSGERFGLMVSGLARSNLRNVRERSNIAMVTWP